MPVLHRSLFAALVFLPGLAQSQTTARIDVFVTDSQSQAIVGARLEISDGNRILKSGESDELGHIEFANLRPGAYRITAKKAGFETVQRDEIQAAAGLIRIDIGMTPTLTRTDSVEVRGTVMEVEESTSVPNKLPPKTARELPSRPTSVADALPLTPGVVREPGGGLILSSSPEHRAALIVNSADVTDPATGQFGLTVPIDSVEVLHVYQTAYLAEYGRFTAGLVSVETKRGGGKWKWEINDPLPEFRIRSYHLRGLKTATPRLNLEGPLITDKLFFSQGVEYAVRKVAVYTLPFPFNQKETAGWNSFSQFDWIASSRHLVTATLHVAPQRLEGLGMDFYNPRPTAPDATTENFTGTVFDRLTLGRGLLENRLSVTRFDTSVWGRGTDDMIISPTGNRGSYFGEQSRTASRYGGASRYSFAPLSWNGSHQFKLGGYLAGSAHTGAIHERPVEIVDLRGRRLSRIAYPFRRDFEISDIEKSFFGQDHWILNPRFALDLGLRTEAQQISGAFRVAPRAGFAWTPFDATRTVFRGGFGLFYDRVPLNVYAFNRYPNQFVTTYGSTGSATSSFLFVNTLGQSRVRVPFVSQLPVDGNFSPRSGIWSFQIEQPVTAKLRLRATYLRNEGEGLVILKRVEPDPQNNTGAFLLEGVGASRYRQFDLVAQLRLRDDRQMFFSYTNSRARGDLNDFGRFLGTVPTAIIRENQYGTLGSDLPHRFLAWGVLRLPRKFQIAPVMEIRSGFPYVETDAAQRYAGIPNRNRFPGFVSLDARVSKDLKVNAKYSVR
ncbi:MAG: TonB-dependent receptor [Candidatus Solibacter usitatus]|nr:TonB-dependent receptor [Candidatus Solibacter usitatus]